ncbi:MAG: hypothetical protein E3J60_02585 [Dehalococcoidia bacterium]|nr:MAG: hypothetical protein E3J60_02585 [Dehalococcoidia bacterium]
MGYELIAIFWLVTIFYSCAGLYCFATRATSQAFQEYGGLEAAPSIADQDWLDSVSTEGDYPTPKPCFSDDWFYSDLAVVEATREVLSQSRLYNKMVTVGSRNVKGRWYDRKRRLIDLLLSPSGDLLEALSPKVFTHLNGYQPKQTVIINRHCLGSNRNAGKVDIYTACDQFYSELGYRSAQDMLNEVEQIKELARSI